VTPLEKGGHYTSTSCITHSLWAPKGYHVVKDKDKRVWSYEKIEKPKFKRDPNSFGFIPDETNRVNEEKLSMLSKALLTPITICFDIATAPVQNFRFKYY